MRLLLAHPPETRSWVDDLAGRYVTDTLGVVTATSDEVIHRWVIELNDTENLDTLAVALKTALTDQVEQPTATVENTSIILEW